MKFQNTAPHDLKFKIDGVTYEVSVGGSCEIPDRIAYVVTGRGLPLKAVPPKPEAAAAPVKLEMTEAELEAATAPDPAPVSRKRK